MGHRQIIDLSISIEPDLPSDPPMMIPQIDYINHEMGAEQMKDFYPGLKKEQLPGSLGWAVEFLTLTTHSGTHLDAPYHYHPTMDKGQRALTIDEIPLDWCFSDGVVLDFRHKADGQRITVDDVQKELGRIGYEIKPLDIVLVQTGADQAWGTEQYLVKGAGMDRESTLYLTERGVKVVGIDAWSWDRPLPFQAKEFQENGDPKVIWEAHFAGIDIGYCHMEKMANLAAIGRPFGFTVCCFPVKIKGASAGWTRPVAIIDEQKRFIEFTAKALEKAFVEDRVTPDEMLACGGKIAPWFSSVTFGGPDLKTFYIGSLRGSRIPYFKSPVAGLPMAHWR